MMRENLIASKGEQGDLANKAMASIDAAVHDYSEFSGLRRGYQILMRRADICSQIFLLYAHTIQRPCGGLSGSRQSAQAEPRRHFAPR